MEIPYYTFNFSLSIYSHFGFKLRNSFFFVYFDWRVANNIFSLSFAAFSKITRMNNSDYEVKLVDTAGQDEYSIFPAQYSMDFHGYVLVYSITSQKSFEVIKIIYEKLIDVMGKA
jgi:GTPase SAR1 family protein